MLIKIKRIGKIKYWNLNHKNFQICFSDGDRLGDVCDNCPNHANNDQKDTDNDE